MRDDLIRRQEMGEAIDRIRLDSKHETFYSFYQKVLKALNEVPTVDAVPVVRCKDCRFATWYTAVDGVKRCFCDNHGSAGHIETDFCSYAEREEEDGTVN